MQEINRFTVDMNITCKTRLWYLELTVDVKGDNIRARYMYKKQGFIHLIARIKEAYQGDSYEYDLLLRKNS